MKFYTQLSVLMRSTLLLVYQDKEVIRAFLFAKFYSHRLRSSPFVYKTFLHIVPH